MLRFSGPQKNILYKEVKETASSVSERVPVVRLDRCRSIISEMIKKVLPSAPKPSNLAEHHINAFSYYFDRAAETGLIGKMRSFVYFLYYFTFFQCLYYVIFRSHTRWIY